MATTHFFNQLFLLSLWSGTEGSQVTLTCGSKKNKMSRFTLIINMTLQLVVKWGGQFC